MTTVRAATHKNFFNLYRLIQGMTLKEYCLKEFQAGYSEDRMLIIAAQLFDVSSA